MGDRAELCPNCAAKSSGGASIGAIRPNVRVVRLKPGEELPEHLRPSNYQSPQPEQVESTPEPEPELSEQAPPTRPQEPYQKPYQQENFVQHSVEQPRRPQATEVTPPPRKEADFARYAGFFLIIAAAWALVVLLRSPGTATLRDLSTEPETNPQSFSHIVIHEKKQVIVDGTKVVGKFQIEDTLVALSAVKAKWSESKNSLELQYTAAPDQPEVESKPGEPALVVWLQFGKLKGRLDRERLQSYMIEYRGGKEPFRMVKSYSIKLASFGEVAPISGSLKSGEKVRGSLRDARSEERDGKVLHLDWELTFDTPVEIIR